jgi:hypothetical protein
MPEVGMRTKRWRGHRRHRRTVTNILVHEKGVTRFVRIPPSAADITLAIARNFGARPTPGPAFSAVKPWRAVPT